jgi:hypothetical protein
VRVPRCTVRCATATGPATSCRCSCGGSNHGRGAGRPAGTDPRSGDASPPSSPRPGEAPSSIEAVFPAVDRVNDYFDPQRFESASAVGGFSSDTWTLRDPRTGRRYILKHCLQGHDADSEVALSRLGRLVGEPMPQTRVAAPDSQVHVISQHVEDNPDEGELLGTGLDYTDSERQSRRLVRELAEPLQPLRLLVQDFVTDNVDRHGGNFLVLSVTGQPGAKRLVPIDHGFALLGAFTGEHRAAWRGGRPPEAWLQRRLAVPTLYHFYEQLSTEPGDLHLLRRRMMAYLTLFAIEEGSITPQQLAEEYDRLGAVWERAVATVDLRDLHPGYVSRAWRLMTARLRALRGYREVHLALLLGESVG